jgi:glutamyl-tRNA synthetase
MSVRTRYAPSPTGDPHVGNIRTALFAWALARANGGQFLLRIEDTDQKRVEEGSLERNYESLRWLGIDWDEGPDIGGPHAPYTQSERLPIYQRVTDELITGGRAYRCFCTPERLDSMRAAQAAAKRPPGYDGLCRSIPAEESKARAGAETFVVRFHMKDEGTTVLEDAVRGTVSFDNALQDDFVILKSDGFPTYHLAAIVDDHLMGITHVLRGEEWLSSAPKHLQINEALGYTPPVYAHLPLILGPDHKKLSKRTGDTATLDYRDNGYLSDGMVNFLALLGWSLDDKTTVISRDELLQNFSLERVVSNPAVFDIDRLNYLNGQYIRALPPDEWEDLVHEWAEKGLPEHIDRPLDEEALRAAAPLLQERVGKLSEISGLVEFLFGFDAPEYDTQLIVDRIGDAETAVRVLDQSLLALDAIGEAGWTRDNIEAAIRGMEEPLGMKLRKFIPALYIAEMGRAQGIPLFDSMEILGRERAIARVRKARLKLG